MHMADALLSPAVGVAMCAVSAGVMAYSSAKIKRDELSEKKLPVMAVAGAFVFAAQMINFTIPGTGSSGHIGGGILLAALLGGFPALLTIAAVLVIQALFFADGGLLALGCNIFNMGVLPCLIVYPLIFKPLTQKGFTGKRLGLASMLSVVMGLQSGAFSVVLETLASGVTELPFSAFLALMQPIHLAIGIVEGIVTAAVLVFVHKLRPEILESARERGAIGKTVSVKKAVIALAVITALVGGGLSLFASAYPDGLEWSMEKVAGTAELEASGGIYDGAASAQDATAFMPDYAFASDSENAAGTSVAGIVGSAVTFALAGAVGLGIAWVKKKKKAAV
ncbi:MAG TPA: energy-coupling factor ABC transporter permease [Clostridia bacterium]|nr:energy-coupling factor ABC transporter permease [Clostridia bacterium]